ncbi:peptidoglycan D,D-transpeptidase FtsI family protein [Paractinoplanes atraurantiacus]|uniref:Cell division protein FtsI (Penicillin-binding protein 3) n=1 Tax=Paractinoplanes atraurantiacus TaxID=1036182 RepID=A0A285ITN4_9ACTN|nr:penicillin-binding protein 2 [Actinoplanes atraurantiacus]SNY51183.1 cell division protein FtsI (penicillin-binding protein 3) [Actinoplanes atraurantiacus]
MSPRADDTPPRRGAQPRRGTSRDLPGEGEETEAKGRGFGGIGDARAYTPRGRTMAERDQRTRSPRAGRNADPFRPALQVLDGGRPRRGGRTEPDETAEAAEAPDIPEQPAGRGRTRKGAAESKSKAAKTRDVRAGGKAGLRGRAAAFDEDEFAEDEQDRRRTRAGVKPRRAVAGSDRGLRAARGSRAGSSTRTSKERIVSGPRVSRAVRAVAPEPPKLANSTRRLRIGAVVALSLFVMIGVRLVVLQVASSPSDAKRLIELREDRLAEVRLPAARGSIVDRNGTVLAHSVEARYIGADPVLVKNPEKTAATLSPLVRVPVSKLLPLIKPHTRPGGGQSRFEYLAQGVDISVGDKIAAMELPGIVVKEDERRDVPNADLAANLIGFTGDDNSGLEGIEARYDSLLRGTDGQRIFEIGKGDLNKPIPSGYEKYTEPQPGTSLRLTIDSYLQFEVQRILCEQATKSKAYMAGAVVMDVKTGEVLAQASCPTYNAAKPGDYSPTDREDVPSSIVADPGSVHKAFIFGAALQEGLITPDSVLTIGPGIERGGYAFNDTHRQKKGTKMTMAGLLAYSSNVGTILIADKLGKQRVYEYQQKFGLGKSTEEGMPGEAEGRLLTPDEWSGSASGSVPIGMSVDATLVQMAAGYNAIANDGTYVQPHLIKSMTSGKDGKVTQSAKPETHKVLDPEVASELRTMMEAVVDNDGATGKKAAVAGYRVSGKTGTGKRLIDGQYTSANYGSFIGMAPAENPRFVIAVSADVPVGTGGDVAAPAFSKMMSFALLHNKVPPSTEPAPKLKIKP